MKPVLIITCRAGSEDWCEEEIGNVLFPYDPEVRVVKTKYPGLLIVYSKLDPLRAYTISLSSEYGFVEKIIPVQIYDKFNIDALDKILNIVGYGEKIKVKADMAVLAAGMVPATADDPVVNLAYRQGPGFRDNDIFDL